MFNWASEVKVRITSIRSSKIATSIEILRYYILPHLIEHKMLNIPTLSSALQEIELDIAYFAIWTGRSVTMEGNLNLCLSNGYMPHLEKECVMFVGVILF